ncbi:tail fiber protein [soil metagenome]
MSDSFIGEIKMFGGNFAILGYAFCDGQLMSIAENDALFSLIGTTYGGDGQTTFGLPDLRGRLPIHQGSGPGLSPRTMGEKSGTESVTLITNQMPAHNHTVVVDSANGGLTNPQNNIVAGSTATPYDNTAVTNQMGNQSIGLMGGSQPHDNMMPYQCVTFIISLYGIYPSRN